MALPLEKENETKTYYFIDTALIAHITLQYSFNSEEREEVEKKLKKDAEEKIIQTVEYQFGKNSLHWVDFKRKHIGNLFCTRKEAETKAKQIIEILRSDLQDSTKE